jgi:hypothetical protein
MSELTPIEAAVQQPAQKATGKRAAAQRSAAKKPAAKKPAARRSVAAATSSQVPEPSFVEAAIATAVKLSEEWDTAGRSLADRVVEVQQQSAASVPSDAYDSLVAAVQAQDLPELLRAHQAYVDIVQTACADLMAGYEAAAKDYVGRLQSSWNASQKEATKQFAKYVRSVRDGLDNHVEDPAAIAQIGLSLVAMSQLAPALLPVA